MTQQIKQDVKVDFAVTGATAAIQTLDTLDAKIKSIKANARGLSSAFNSLNNVNGINGAARSLRTVNSQLAQTQKKAKMAAVAVKDINGNTQRISMSAVKTPKALSLTDMSSQVGGYGMKTTQAAVSATNQIGQSATKLTKVQSALSRINSASQSTGKYLSNLSGYFKSAGDSAEKANWNFFRTRAILAAIASVVAIAGVGMKKWFDLASDYAEANHLFYTTLASSLDDVSAAEKTATIQGKDLFGNLTGDSVAVTPAVAAAADEVDRLSQAMMLDPTQVKRTYATFYEMANAAGMATDKVMKLSQGMTQLTYDLSSLWDKPFDETASKLQSGISGISTAVKSYGIDISRTAADQWLMDNAIDATYNDLDRANKMIVMYNMLMEHTTTAQGDLARSALQPANMFRILGQQATVAGRMLGAAVFPVVTKLIPLFVMLAQAIQAVAARLSAFLGNKLGDWYKDAQSQWNSYLSNLDTSFNSGGLDIDDNAADDLSDIGDAADDTAKKLKEITNFTLPFDELHMLAGVSDTSGTANGGNGQGNDKGGSVGGIDIPIADPYQWDTNLSDILVGDAAKTLQQLKDMIDNVFDPGTAQAFGDTVNRIWDTIKRNTDKIYQSVKTLLSAFDEDWDWVDFLNGVGDGFDWMNTALTNLITTVINMFPGAVDILKNLPLLGPIFQLLFDNLDSGTGILLGMSLALVPFRGAWKLVSGVFKGVIGVVGKLFKPFSDIVSKVKNIIKPVKEAGKAVEGLGGKFAEVVGATKLGKFVTGIGKAFGPVGIVLTIGSQLSYVATTMLPKGLEKWTQVLESGDPIGGYFNMVKDYVFTGEMIDDILGLNLWPGALEDLKNLFWNLNDFFGGIGATIGTTLWGVFQSIGDALTSFGQGVWQTLFNLFNSIDQTVKGVIGAIGDTFTNMRNSVVNTVQELVNNVGGFFQSLYDTAVNITTNLWNNLGQIWQNIQNTVGGAVSNVGSTITNGFQWAIDGVRNIWSGITWALTNPIESAKNIIGNLVSTIQNLFHFDFRMPEIKLPHFRWSTMTVGGFSFPMFSGIDWYAKGGIFDQATIAGIGEAGPEAVVPLQGARMQPFAEAIASNLHSTGSASASSSDMDWDTMIVAMSSAVYNAVVQGFPREIVANTYLDTTKVNKELDKNKRQSGAGTSLVSAVR